MTNNKTYASAKSLRSKPPTRRFAEITLNNECYRMRSLNDREFAELGKAPTNQASVALIVLMVCDGNGDPVYSEEDRELWREQDSSLVQALAGACLDHLNNVDMATAKND